ncbi:zinc-dependent MarR family transcriptional regulator [Streptococcus sp. S784/96/1]|uniref:zinc-dependent MarR family transcriptional regulator n=1 Tax=Streptococcus sp. S784/96/1 TaxID=2653499 RepID=UPI00138A2854|nr:zinc-dependent MarR family transcriptional regulator [Streptococcus sp. S784/96/1]
MTELAHQLDALINRILLKAENQHELLIGSCESHVKLTNTQEHILMLLSQENLTSSDLAKRLNVSQAAVTKAVKSLVGKGMLETTKKEEDGRSLHLTLTADATPIAEEHRHHHDKTISVYNGLLEDFSEEEQLIISRFITIFSKRLED